MVPLLLAAAFEFAQGDQILRDFRFASGETLPELRIHYRTAGKPHRDAQGRVDNAVLILHGTTGSGAQFAGDNFAGVLFGPGQLLDAERFFLVVPDGIGHGQSSKPSDGLHARFPRYRYADMVEAQWQLLRALGVDHLRLVMGTSMGGMHSWMWAEAHPGFIDAAMPLASLPVAIAGRNRVVRKMVSDAIRTDPSWKGGEYREQPRGLLEAIDVLLLMTSAPVVWQREAPTADVADRFLDEQRERRRGQLDANDMLYAFEASRDYDPSAHLESIAAPLTAVNSADDFVNPPELGILEREIQRVKNGKAVVLPISPETRGHGTHSYPAIWKDHLAELLRRSAR